MPQPTPGDVHVDSLLTGISVAFLQSPNKFVADVVFPRVGVQKQSDKYATFDRADFLRDEMQRRGPGSASAGGGYRVSNDSYLCEVWAFHKDVDDQTVANADGPFQPRRNAVNFVTGKELIKREVEWCAHFFTTSVWTGSTTAADLVAGTDFTAWDDPSSDPIGLMADQCAEVESNTGMWPTDLTLNRRAWLGLKNHPDILDRIRGAAGPGNPAIVTQQAVAALMELERIHVAAGVRNTAGEGLTAVTDYIAGNHALLTYRPASAGLEIPSAGYTFVWNGLMGMAEGRRIKSFRLEEIASDRVEIEAAWDQKVVSSICGVFFQNVVS